LTLFDHGVLYQGVKPDSRINRVSFFSVKNKTFVLLSVFETLCKDLSSVEEINNILLNISATMKSMGGLLSH